MVALVSNAVTIQIYTTSWCGYCTAAKRLLQEAQVSFEEIEIDDLDPAFRSKLFDLTGGWTVPQIVVDGNVLGGYQELRRLGRDRLRKLAQAA